MLDALIQLFGSLDQTVATWVQLYGGWALGVVALIVFVETGLVVMPFLPGDSLLFITGSAFAAAGLDLHAAVAVLTASALAGNIVNFTVGRWAGAAIVARGWLRRSHLEQAHGFFERWGGLTVVAARFVPIVRTVVPFVAGAGTMGTARFVLYSAVGALSWVALFVYGGAALGSVPFVRDHLALLALGVVVLSVLPAVWAAWKARTGGGLGAERQAGRNEPV